MKHSHSRVCGSSLRSSPYNLDVLAKVNEQKTEEIMDTADGATLFEPPAAVTSCSSSTVSVAEAGRIHRFLGKCVYQKQTAEHSDN